MAKDKGHFYHSDIFNLQTPFKGWSVLIRKSAVNFIPLPPRHYNIPFVLSAEEVGSMADTFPATNRTEC